MPSPTNEFAHHCAELLAPLGAVRLKRMFGGHGLYVDDLFMAILIAERLYLKADALSRNEFEAAGCEPFRYEARGKLLSMSYFSPPDETLESAALMRPWARLALDAALRARAATAAKPPAVKRSRGAAKKKPAGATPKRAKS